MKQAMLLFVCMLALTNVYGQVLSSVRQNPPKKTNGKPPGDKVRMGLGNKTNRPDKVENTEVDAIYSTLEGGDSEAARAQFLNYADSDADAAYGLALTYYFDGQTDQAIAGLNKAVSLDPSNTDALYLLGELYAEQGSYEEASEALFALLEVDETDADAWYLLGLLYFNSDDEPSANVCLEQARLHDEYYQSESYD
jgi:tetratricopeptide (TPR) repeat protein